VYLDVLSFHLIFHYFTPRYYLRINRPGGTGRITKIHFTSGDDDNPPVVEGLDVKYTVYSGHDYHLDPDLVQPHEELETRGRRRRTVEPVVETENAKPHQQQLQRRKSKTPNVMTAAAKKSAAKTKTPTKQQPKKAPVRKKGARKVLQAIVQAAVSPTVVSSQSSELGIPREIIIDPSNTPGSGFSSSDRTADAFCSPLGQEGVESQQVSSASYKHLMLMQSDTAKAQRNMIGRMQDDDNLSTSSDEDKMECDNDNHVLQLQLPTTHALSQQRMLESNLSATHLAVGCYLMENEESVKSPKKKSGQAKAPPPVDAVAHVNSSSYDDESVASKEKAAARVHLSLREVFDNGVKQASQFIGDVVNGAAKPKEPTHDTSQADVDDNRLNQFRAFLNEVLLNSDGMVEVTTVADQMLEYAAQAGDLTFDYTDDEVNNYLTQLCAQNKIMRTEGWIYNI
jgi:hypothetical protein